MAVFSTATGRFFAPTVSHQFRSHRRGESGGRPGHARRSRSIHTGERAHELLVQRALSNGSEHLQACARPRSRCPSPICFVVSCVSVVACNALVASNSEYQCARDCAGCGHVAQLGKLFGGEDSTMTKDIRPLKEQWERTEPGCVLVLEQTCGASRVTRAASRQLKNAEHAALPSVKATFIAQMLVLFPEAQAEVARPTSEP